MTRYTDFGRKRTYLQAGFDEPDAKAAAASTSANTAGMTALSQHETVASDSNAISTPAKKKRKRTPKSKRDNYKGPTQPLARSELQRDGSRDPATSSGAAAEGTQKDSDAKNTLSEPKKKTKKRPKCECSRNVYHACLV
jgi:zinc finger CCHC domain-containing protein 9